MARPALKQRHQCKRRFLLDGGWADAHSVFLAGDASPRHYERLTLPEGTTAILMDASAVPHQVPLFVDVADRLLASGLSAPEIFYDDQTHGYVLTEDLGDLTFTRALHHVFSEDILYRLALDVLLHMQCHTRHEGLRSLTRDAFLSDLSVFLDWYAPSSFPKTDFLAAWEGTWSLIAPLPMVFVHKDFHVDNLLYLDSRKGRAQCGLLDFQDAASGPGLFDLVSLLEDARRDVDPHLQNEIKSLYFRHFPESTEEAYAWLGVHRSTRILGIFQRLAKRDHKKGYMVHEARVWSYIAKGLKHPALAALRPFYQDHFPQCL